MWAKKKRWKECDEEENDPSDRPYQETISPYLSLSLSLSLSACICVCVCV